jgi:hypothetical protein
VNYHGCHIFLATTTKTNTSGNTLFYTDIMSNKHFLGVFSATHIFNHDNSRFFGNVFIYIYLSYKVYSVIVMVNKRQYLLRLWATPGGLFVCRHYRKFPFKLFLRPQTGKLVMRSCKCLPRVSKMSILT